MSTNSFSKNDVLLYRSDRNNVFYPCIALENSGDTGRIRVWVWIKFPTEKRGWDSMANESRLEKLCNLSDFGIEVDDFASEVGRASD